MNQNQCVPSWEVGDAPPLAAVAPPAPPPPPPSPPPSRVVVSGSHSTSLSAGQDTSLLDYEVAELTWENGQLTMHGLGLPRVASKSNLASGTLESVVNQATKKPHPGGACNATPDSDLAPWFAPAPASVSMDALVPTPNTGGGGACCIGCSNTRVGSCSTGSDWSVSGSESTRRDTRQQMSGGVNGLTSTSPENTKTVTVDDHDSVCHCRPQKERGKEEENEKKGTRKSSISTKRSRAAAIHSQSERKRRDKINQRMKTLQKLVPNSSKTDKASTLDEVIDYLKQLQAQVQMMSRMSLPTMTMMMPMTIQQQLQQSMMSQMGMGVRMGMTRMGVDMGIGIGVGIDQMNMNVNSGMTQPQNIAGMAVPTLNPSQNVARIIVPTLSPSQNVAGIAVPTLNPSVFMPLVPWDGTSTIGGDRVSSSHQPSMVPIDPVLACLACQQSQQPMTIDAYSKMVTVYQQLQRQQ